MCLFNLCVSVHVYSFGPYSSPSPVFRVRMRIRMFLGLLNPDPSFNCTDPSFNCTDPSFNCTRIEIIYCKRAILPLSSSKILTPHPPLRPASVYPPPLLRGRTHSPGGEGDGGSIFWKTREIGCPLTVNNLSTIVRIRIHTKMSRIRNTASYKLVIRNCSF
jgi:hypothetical protein